MNINIVVYLFVALAVKTPERHKTTYRKVPRLACLGWAHTGGSHSVAHTRANIFYSMYMCICVGIYRVCGSCALCMLVGCCCYVCWVVFHDGCGSKRGALSTEATFNNNNVLSVCVCAGCASWVSCWSCASFRNANETNNNCHTAWIARILRGGRRLFGVEHTAYIYPSRIQRSHSNVFDVLCGAVGRFRNDAQRALVSPHKIQQKISPSFSMYDVRQMILCCLPHDAGKMRLARVVGAALLMSLSFLFVITEYAVYAPRCFR